MKGETKTIYVDSNLLLQDPLDKNILMLYLAFSDLLH